MRRRVDAAVLEVVPQRLQGLLGQRQLVVLGKGSLDGVVTNVRAAPWDSVVGAGLVEAAGGTVTDIDGDPWRHDSTGLVASNGEAHGAVLEAARVAER